MAVVLVFFFFSSRRRHTRWPRDWSSDVCSSDLDLAEVDAALVRRGELAHRFLDIRRHAEVLGEEIVSPERQNAERNAGSGEALDRGRHRAIAARDDHRPRLRGGLIESVLQFPRGDRMNVARAARRREGALDSGAEILAGKCRGRPGGRVDEDERLHEELRSRGQVFGQQSGGMSVPQSQARRKPSSVWWNRNGGTFRRRAALTGHPATWSSPHSPCALAGYLKRVGSFRPAFS